MSSLADDLSLLTEAVEAAGREAMRFFRRNPRRWEKPGEAGPVTEADLAADGLLKARLGAARPAYGWLSEESPDDAARLACERVFIVDPIDGTRAFIAGETGWCVAAAVVERGRPVVAAAWFPAAGAFYAASEGGGATRDGAPIAASARSRLEGAAMLATAGHLKAEHWPGGAPTVARSFRSSLTQRMCLVAEGAFDAMLTFRDAWEWDIAAGELIAREAGCAVTDGLGLPYRYNGAPPRSAGVVVAPPALHAAILARRQPRDTRLS